MRTMIWLTSIGLFLQTYPNIMGMDVAGEVFELGDGVSHVRKGDRVIGYASLTFTTQLPSHCMWTILLTERHEDSVSPS